MSALGEKDAIATHARLLSERRVGFLILAFGLALYLAGLVLGTSEGIVVMAVFAAGMLALGLGAVALWMKVGTKRVSRQTHEAARSEDAEVSDHRMAKIARVPVRSAIPKRVGYRPRARDLLSKAPGCSRDRL
jgi:hypothetical protein